MKTNSAFTLWSGPVTETGMELFPNGIPFILLPGCKLTDSQALTGAFQGEIEPSMWCNRYHFNLYYSTPVYDDSWGPAFIFRDTSGVQGVARARTWGDAYEICEDEFFPEADESIEDLRAEYNSSVGGDDWYENELFCESYGFRPNGVRSNSLDGKQRDVHGHGIYQKDLNGEALDELTPETRERLKIHLVVENQYSDLPFDGSYSIS